MHPVQVEKGLQPLRRLRPFTPLFFPFVFTTTHKLCATAIIIMVRPNLFISSQFMLLH